MTTDVTGIETPAGKPNPFERIVGVFVEPVKTMRAIAARPDALVVVIVMMLLAAAGSYAAAARVDLESEIRQQMAKNPNISQLPQDKVEQAVEQGTKVGTLMFQWGWVSLPVMIAIAAGALFVVFSMFGGHGRFGQAFALTAYSWLPLSARGLIAAAVVAMRQDPTTPTAIAAASYTNPAFLVSVEQSRALFMLMSALDVFTFFTLFLLTIGFSEASGLSRRASGLIVGGLWLVTVLLRVVPAVLQS